MEINTEFGVICKITGRACSRGKTRCSACDLNKLSEKEKVEIKKKKLYLIKSDMKSCHLLEGKKNKICVFKDYPVGCEECFVIDEKDEKDLELKLSKYKALLKKTKQDSGVCEYTGLPCLRSALKSKCEACHIPHLTEKKLKDIGNGGNMNGRKKI